MSAVAAIRLEFLTRLAHDAGPVTLTAYRCGAVTLHCGNLARGDATPRQWTGPSVAEVIDLAREDACLLLRTPHGMAPSILDRVGQECGRSITGPALVPYYCDAKLRMDGPYLVCPSCGKVGRQAS